MKQLKVKMIPVLVAIAALIVLLVAYIVFGFQRVSAADSLSLGRQYLNDMDYSAAIVEFGKAIELDPNNGQARVGLAKAYAGEGNKESAKQVIADITQNTQPQEEVLVEMTELLQQMEESSQAIQTVQQLIDKTDKTEYYDKLNEILGQLYGSSRSFAQGQTHSLRIREGKVYAKGDNTVGQLGIGLETATSGSEVDAQFGAVAKKVAIAGRTSLVIDENGQLWAAGENFWGQWGEGYASTTPQAGWTQIVCPGSVVEVAGTTGRLVVLLQDGTLWTAGAANSMQWTQLFSQQVMQISASATSIAVLTTDGKLYMSQEYAPESWQLLDQNVSSMAVTENDCIWNKQDGTIKCYNYGVSFPSDWMDENGNFRPTLPIEQMAASGYLLVLVNEEGAYALQNGNLHQAASLTGQVQSVYGQSGGVVLEMQDGSVWFWSENAAEPAAMA